MWNSAKNQLCISYAELTAGDPLAVDPLKRPILSESNFKYYKKTGKTAGAEPCLVTVRPLWFFMPPCTDVASSRRWKPARGKLSRPNPETLCSERDDPTRSDGRAVLPEAGLSRGVRTTTHEAGICQSCTHRQRFGVERRS
ncbi:MAG: hypothetical protein ACLR6J_00245 [Parabacteroides merdae]